MKRCAWANVKNQLYIDYHDDEWGIPVHDDNVLFEFLVLEGAQAGLSWETILNKREGYRKAFKKFKPCLVAKMTQKDVEKLMQDASIVRNRLKINSAITNAQNFLKVQKEFGTFSKYLWGWVGNRQIVNKWKEMSDVPAVTDLAEEISKDLKKRGFKFVGPTIIYAYMQSMGLVNDHTIDCFRYKKSPN